MSIPRTGDYPLAFPLYQSADPTALAPGLTPTVKVSKDGGAFATATNAPTEPSAQGVYVVVLTEAERNAESVAVLAHADTAVDQVIMLITDPVLNDLSQAEAQAAAAAALTAYDAATDADVDASEAAVIAALPSEPPTTEAIADAVWDEPLADHADTGSTGATVERIRNRAERIGTAGATVVAPVTDTGDIIIFAGDDYSSTDDRAIIITVAVADVPSLTGATVRLKAAQATWTATSCVSDGTDWSIKFEPTKAQTALLTIARQSYEIEAMLATTARVLTIATGTLFTRRDIPAVS